MTMWGDAKCTKSEIRARNIDNNRQSFIWKALTKESLRSGADMHDWTPSKRVWGTHLMREIMQLQFKELDNLCEEQGRPKQGIEARKALTFT